MATKKKEVPVAGGSSDLKDHAVAGDLQGTDATDFNEAFPPIVDTTPFLRCRATGEIYPNQPPFNSRSDIVEPYHGTAPVVGESNSPLSAGVDTEFDAL